MKKLPVKNVLNFHPELQGSEDKVLERKGLTTDFNANELNQFESIGILSSPKIDADGDILDPAGIDTSIFNGVVIFNHDLGELPIGTITEIKMSPEGVTGKFKFSETYAFAQDCYNLIKEKILKGISVGYLPVKVLKKGTTAFNELAKLRGWITEGAERIVAEWQLVEVSVCNIGCNSEALQLAAKNFTSEITFKNFKIEKAVEDVSGTDVTAEFFEEKKDIDAVVEPVVAEVQTTPETLTVEDITQTDPVQPDVSKIEPDVSEKQIAEEPVIVEEKPAPVIRVIRRGGYVSTQETKQKALLFLQGKSF